LIIHSFEKVWQEEGKIMQFLDRGTPMRIASLALIVLLILVAGCGTPTPAATPIAAPTSTPAATATPLPGEVLLVTNGVTDPALLSFAQETLTRLASGSGYTLKVLPAATPADLAPQVVVAVFLAPPADLPALLSATPQTQFVVVSPAELPQSENLSVILANPQDQAFLAGYTAILLSNDWRAGGLLPGGTPEDDLLQQSFVNGGAYFCGTCSPLYPPYMNFPIQGSLPAGSDANAWIGMSNQLMANRLNVMYVSPEAASPELYNYLASQNLVILGAGTPPESDAARYAGSVIQDPITPIETLWPDLTSGKGGTTVAADLLFAHVNSTLLSEGRQHQAEQLIEQLRNGLILTRNP
jgi:hypothetical protein